MSRPKADRSPLSTLPDGKSAAGISPALPAICARIRIFREGCGKEQKQLAREIGVTGNAVSNWENGRSRPDLSLIPGLCRALGITLYDLFGVSGPSSLCSEDEKALLDHYRALSRGHRAALNGLAESLLAAQQEAQPPLRQLIFYGRPLSAGPGDPTEFDAAGTPLLCYSSQQVDRADCVFPVNGDSMEPSFHDGDLVLVSRIPNAPPLRFGEVGAFISGNETYIKVYEQDGLHSLNPSFPNLSFGENDAVYLIGRVIGVLDPDQLADPLPPEC